MDHHTPLGAPVERGDDDLSVVVERDPTAGGMVRLEPGEGSGVTAYPRSATRGVTSSHAQAPSQKPGTRTI